MPIQDTPPRPDTKAPPSGCHSGSTPLDPAFTARNSDPAPELSPLSRSRLNRLTLRPRLIAPVSPLQVPPPDTHTPKPSCHSESASPESDAQAPPPSCHSQCAPPKSGLQSLLLKPPRPALQAVTRAPPPEMGFSRSLSVPLCSLHVSGSVALLSRPAAVAVALLLVGAMGRVPIELLRLVGQHHFHCLQRLGDGAFLQRAAFLGGDKAQVTNHTCQHSYQEKCYRGLGRPRHFMSIRKTRSVSHQS